MATTTNYGWTTPDDTALVKDGASAIRSLGSSIDTSVKSLNPGTTSGDIDYYTSSTAKARLAKGTAGQVLTMNSGATAPEWAAPSGVDALLTPEISGLYVRTHPCQTGAVNTSITPTTNTTYYQPIYLSAATYDRIVVQIAGYTSTGNTRLGIYNASLTTGLPTTVLLDAGVVSVTSATTFTITINQTVTAGWYYLAVNRQSGSYTFNAVAGNLIANNFLNNVGTTATNLIQEKILGFSQASVTGAFGTATSLTNQIGDTPVIGLRFA